MTKTCAKCDKAKKLSNFTKNINSKDGLQVWCKKCKATYDKNRKLEKRKLKPITITSTKKCSKCKHPKSLLSFSKDKSKKDGLQTWCKKCQSVSNKNRNWKRNKKNPVIKKTLSISAMNTVDKTLYLLFAGYTKDEISVME